jgi:hypothetical protein
MFSRHLVAIFSRHRACFGTQRMVKSLATAVLMITLAAGAPLAHAGPEISLREFASGQIKKGVRSIGMGGDGATLGNYALIYRDAGTAVLDYGLVHYDDTGNQFTFSAVGFTSPLFWDDAALYVIAMSQHASDIHTWSLTPPSARKPSSTGDGSNQAVFVKLAKPITKTLSAGILLSYELSQMTLLPDAGGPAITYRTAWRPSGGAGLSWQPASFLLLGARALLSNDGETRIDGAGSRSGFARSYEYRLGAAVFLWDGTIVDLGVAALDRYNELDATSSFKVAPALGAEQAIVRKHLWVRAGLDETTWTFGVSGAVSPLKLDLALLRNLGVDRTSEIFGKRNLGAFATLSFDYERPPAPAAAAPSPE